MQAGANTLNGSGVNVSRGTLSMLVARSATTPAAGCLFINNTPTLRCTTARIRQYERHRGGRVSGVCQADMLGGEFSGNASTGEAPGEGGGGVFVDVVRHAMHDTDFEQHGGAWGGGIYIRRKCRCPARLTRQHSRSWRRGHRDGGQQFRRGKHTVLRTRGRRCGGFWVDGAECTGQYTIVSNTTDQRRLYGRRRSGAGRRINAGQLHD